MLLVTGSLAAETNSTRSLADLSLEQLMNETVTSVSRKEQRLGDAAAAITVLSNEDLRRSGATSIADALRWVPGMNVSSINASQWAVSPRGFNGLYANKLLVLVDGRAVYTALYAGVHWDLQQMMLADVDRVEVIRGPGAAVWGANAVNGVINIESRSARDTQGSYAYAGGGDVQQALGGARYGGQLGDRTFYRVFGSYQLTDDYPLPSGADGGDAWHSWHGGFRLDHYADEATHATWQGDATQSEFDPRVSDAYNVNTLGRWRRELGERSAVEIQAYVDRTHRDDITMGRGQIDTFDLSAQHTFGLGERHDVIWGLGYRHLNSLMIQKNPFVTVLDRNFGLSLASAFVQDDFQLISEQLTVTLGSKLEHNDITGWEVQPSLRLSYKPAEHQTLWAAISRAVRTPSEVEGLNLANVVYGPPVAGPGGTYVPVITGNPNVDAEVLWAYEVGYRARPLSRVNLELNAFFNDYERILAVGPVGRFDPGTPGVAWLPFGNHQHGHTYGGEASLTWAATDAWRLTASYSLLIARIQGAAGSDPESPEESAPRNQVLVRSAYDFSARLSLDLQARYVDCVRSAPSYITADFQLTYRPAEHWELSLVGRNLLDSAHPEFGWEPMAVTTEIPRSFYGKISWRF
jgi:iron complex outermembrane receptor protein